MAASSSSALAENTTRQSPGWGIPTCSNNPCFEEDDACLNLPNTSLLLCYNPAQVLKMGGKHYLTGPVILARTNMDGETISLTIDEVYLFQKYLASHSIMELYCSLILGFDVACTG